jgi:hypothetical protein
VARVISSIEPIELNTGATVADVLKADKGVRADLEEWLNNRPVTRLEFRDDLGVELTLAASPADAFAIFRNSAARARDRVPGDEGAWTKVRERWVQHMAVPVGVGRVPAAAATATSKRAGGAEILASQPVAAVQGAPVLPARPPDWVTHQLDAEGVGSVQGSKLRSARLAEADALGKLREQVEALSLSRDQHVGDLAREDPRIAQAVDRALGYARIAKTDYRADSSATVRLVLDLRDLWEEMRHAR